MRRWTVTLLAAFVALVTIAPLLWMVSVSFMAPGEAARVPPPLLPENATLENYRQLFGTYGALRFLANSLLVSNLATTIALLFNVPAGYAFAKMRFRGRTATFSTLVSELVVPHRIGMRPLSRGVKGMGRGH